MGYPLQTLNVARPRPTAGTLFKFPDPRRRLGIFGQRPEMPPSIIVWKSLQAGPGIFSVNESRRWQVMQ